MKLVCPHCAKVIDVPETAAGQTTNCSLCHGPLTVPFTPTSETPPASPPPAGPPTSLPPLPPPPPPPPVPDPLAPTTAWPPSTKSGTVIPPLAPPPLASTTPSGVGRGAEILARLQQVKLPDEFHHWFGLGVLVVLFFLFFFPWTGVNVGDTNLVSQSGLAVAFGYGSALPEGANLTKGLPGASMLMLAFLACLVGLLLLIVILVERLVHAPAVQNMKPTLQRIAALKDHVVLGCLLLVTLIFLLYYVFAGFPLEQAAFSEKASDTMLMGLKLKTDGIEKVKSYEMVGLQWYHRRCWFGFSTLLALVATLWVGCRWLAARGYTKKWPKVVLQWPAGDSPQLTFDAQTPVSELTRKS